MDASTVTIAVSILGAALVAAKLIDRVWPARVARASDPQLLDAVREQTVIMRQLTEAVKEQNAQCRRCDERVVGVAFAVTRNSDALGRVEESQKALHRRYDDVTGPRE